MRPDHPLTKTNLSLAKFAAAEHLLVSLSGDSTGLTDQVLAQHGLTRRIAMTVNHFSSVSDLLKGSDLIAVVPSTAVHKAIFSGELAVVEPPVQINPHQVSSFWHKRQEKDQGLIWFREHVNRLIKEQAHSHFEELKRRICGKCS